MKFRSALLEGTLTVADAAALGCDGVLKEKKGLGPAVEPTPFSFSNGGSGKCLLKDFRTCAAHATRAALRQILHGKMARVDEVTSLLWDPMDQQSYALRWADPGNRTKSPPRASAAANALAFVGLSTLTAVPIARRLAPIGMNQRARQWTWPIWTVPIAYPTAQALLASASLQAPESPAARLRPLGVETVYQCRRFFLNKRPFFSPARAIG